MSLKQIDIPTAETVRSLVIKHRSNELKSTILEAATRGLSKISYSHLTEDEVNLLHSKGYTIRKWGNNNFNIEWGE